MELYIKCSFWLGAFMVVIRFISLAIVPYPRTVSWNGDLANLAVNLPFFVWVSVLFFNL